MNVDARLGRSCHKPSEQGKQNARSVPPGSVQFNLGNVDSLPNGMSYRSACFSRNAGPGPRLNKCQKEMSQNELALAGHACRRIHEEAKPSLRLVRSHCADGMLCPFFYRSPDSQFVVGPIKKDLGISDTRIGLLQGLAFALFYTAMGLPLGRIADTWSRRGLIAVSIMIWSCFTAACSFARTFASLFVTRIGVGIGEAGLSPAAYSMIADYFVKEQLGVAMSVFYMGVFIGSSLALLLGD